MKTIYLECNMGAAGDMLMSALYEICDQKEWFLHKMNTVFAPYHIVLSPESAVSCGINGTHMKVTVDGTEEVSLDVKAGHAHHTHAESPGCILCPRSVRFCGGRTLPHAHHLRRRLRGDRIP